MSISILEKMQTFKKFLKKIKFYILLGNLLLILSACQFLHFTGAGLSPLFRHRGVSDVLDTPKDIEVISDRFIYVLEARKISKIDIHQNTVQTLKGGLYEISTYGITLQNDQLFMTDRHNRKILKMELETNIMSVFAGSGDRGWKDGTRKKAQFNLPWGIDNNEKFLYISDRYAVRQIDPVSGIVTTITGSDERGWKDGLGKDARFGVIAGLEIDEHFLYIADFSNHVIRKMDLQSRYVSTIAGSGEDGWKDGIGPEAEFDQPYGITKMGKYLYVTEQNNDTVRKIDIETGETTTLAGNGDFGWKDGVGTQAQFRFPSGIDNDGTYLYVADRGNWVIRKIDPKTAEVTTLDLKRVR